MECLDHDVEDDYCEELVAELRALEGSIFQETANFLEGYRGVVMLMPNWGGNEGYYSDRQIRIGTGGSINANGGWTPAGSADRYIVAVHEALGHGAYGIGSEYGPAGAGHFNALLSLEEAAFDQLGSLGLRAPLAYERLIEYGRPVSYRPPAPR